MHDDDERLALRLLQALYDLGRTDTPATPGALCAWLEVPEERVRALLQRLDAQELVDEARCRLSMKGLVLAVSMDGAQKLARQSHAA